MYNSTSPLKCAITHILRCVNQLMCSAAIPQYVLLAFYLVIHKRHAYVIMLFYVIEIKSIVILTKYILC